MLRVIFSEEGGFDTRHWWPLYLLAKRLYNILSESTPLVAILVPPLSSMAPVSKALILLPQKSDRSDKELRKHRQSCMLRFGKCLRM